jgi:nicotinamide-nucleotide amidase
MSVLPDDLAAVTGAFTAALERADLVVSTGGLGPTPDDLTREAIGACVGEVPVVDPGLERWLRALWRRRRLDFPVANLKQAWLIPSAAAISNGNGTAPGWWVERPDDRIIVALPGPPREMGPMWRDQALPRLAERGLGLPAAVTTLRLTGIGESMLADQLADLLLAPDPVVATYARPDGVDIRVSAVDGPTGPADARVAAAVEDLEHRLGDFIWGRDAATWPMVIDRALATGPWSLTIVEVGTAGSVGGLLGSVAALRRAVSLGADDQEARPVGRVRDATGGLAALAARARSQAGTEVTLAVHAVDAPTGGDTSVGVVVLGPADRLTHERRTVFLRGEVARGRVAAAAAHVLLGALASSEAPATPEPAPPEPPVS